MGAMKEFAGVFDGVEDLNKTYKTTFERDNGK
jgi:glycine betaine/choline ABC-type transport system substrate-binding protein